MSSLYNLWFSLEYPKCWWVKFTWIEYLSELRIRIAFDIFCIVLHFKLRQNRFFSWIYKCSLFFFLSDIVFHFYLYMKCRGIGTFWFFPYPYAKSIYLELLNVSGLFIYQFWNEYWEFMDNRRRKYLYELSYIFSYSWGRYIFLYCVIT